MLNPIKAKMRNLLVPRLMPAIAEEERAYLNAAVSLYDLERRQREVEAGLFRDRYIA